MGTYKIELNKHQSEFLSHLPEQGMGYQIVDLTLKNGIVLKSKVVLNCSFLQLDDNEQLKTEDIDKIELHRE
jgi:hypothetical protein